MLQQGLSNLGVSPLHAAAAGACVVPLQVKTILDKKKAGGLDASIVSYPKQAHGFSLRGDSSDATVAQAATTAFDAGRSFLDKYLK